MSVFKTLSPAFGQETNGPTLATRPLLDRPESEVSSGLILRYDQEFLKRSSGMIDRFGPPSYLGWTRLFNTEGYRIHQEINSSGANGTFRLLTDSLRETAVSRLPVDQWAAVGQLFVGSLGNTAEEHSQTISPILSDSDLAWQKGRFQERAIRYGFRPWRSDPYGYFSTRVGHWGGLENLPIFVFETRLGYRLMHAGKLEGRIVAPLPHNFQFVGGISTDPLHIVSSSNLRMSGRLEYVFEKNISSRAIYLGAQSGGHEFLLAAGCILSW